MLVRFLKLAIGVTFFVILPVLLLGYFLFLAPVGMGSFISSYGGSMPDNWEAYSYVADPSGRKIIDGLLVGDEGVIIVEHPDKLPKSKDTNQITKCYLKLGTEREVTCDDPPKDQLTNFIWVEEANGCQLYMVGRASDRAKPEPFIAIFTDYIENYKMECSN